MVLAYEAYVIHYASVSQPVTLLILVGGTVAAFHSHESRTQKSGINETRFA